MQTTDQARFSDWFRCNQKQISAAQLAAATSSVKGCVRYLQLPRTLPKGSEHLPRKSPPRPRPHTKRYTGYPRLSNQIRASRIQNRHAAPVNSRLWIIFFDSPIGYCDNFSSAMVVLCRSIGLPARWAKDSTLAHCSAVPEIRKMHPQQQCPFMAGSLFR